MPNLISKSVKISDLVSIEESSKGSVLKIGDNCVIDSFVKIKFTGGIGDIVIGNNVYLNSGCVLYSGNGILIGNSVLFGPNCSIVPTNHEFKSMDNQILYQGFQPSKGGIIIEDDVWIGASVTILDGAHIKRGAVIGANSLVRGIIEEFTINVGSPTKVVGKRS